MKLLRYTLLAVLLTATIGASAQTLKLHEAKSQVLFRIKNLGSWVDGTFTGMNATGVWNPANLSGSHLDATVKANTVTTGSKGRDKSLRGEDYFAVEQHPTIRIKSTSIEKNGNSYLLKGKLTIKNITKDIEMPFTASELGSASKLTGTLKLNCKDYKVGGNSFVMSDDVEITIVCMILK